MNAAASNGLDWATFVATGLAAIAATGVLAVYCYQAHIMNRARQGTSFIEILRFLQSDEMRRDRETLYALESVEPDVLMQPGNEKGLLALERVALALNSAAFMARKKMVPKDHLVDNWGSLYERCWPLIQPWAEYRRGRVGDLTALWSDLEALADEVIASQAR